VLVYGYTTGVFSSRKLERATYDSVAFRFTAANDHPDRDSIATFRRRFLKGSGASAPASVWRQHPPGFLGAWGASYRRSGGGCDSSDG
jgi:hypothetical protein